MGDSERLFNAGTEAGAALLWGVRSGRFCACALLDLGEEVEKGVNALLQLCFDLVPRAFEQVQREARRVAVFEFDGAFPHPGYLVGGKQTQTINKSQIRHIDILFLRPPGGTYTSGRYNRKGILAHCL